MASTLTSGAEGPADHEPRADAAAEHDAGQRGHDQVREDEQHAAIRTELVTTTPNDA